MPGSSDRDSGCRRYLGQAHTFPVELLERGTPAPLRLALLHSELSAAQGASCLASPEVACQAATRYVLSISGASR